MNWRNSLILAGFGLLGASQLHRAAAPLTRGLGAILTLHHVRPEQRDSFAPNSLLAVTPAFLDRTIRRLRELGYDIVALDEAVRRLIEGAPSKRRFAVLTFDDGFRDNLDYALPVLERHAAPATFYITTGFADRTARLWWVELEEAIRRAEQIAVTVRGEDVIYDTGTPQAKAAAFKDLYWRLRRGSEEDLLDVIGGLCRAHGVSSSALVDALCLTWSDVEAMARNPLVTIGAHTVSHPMLAKHGEAEALAELIGGRAILEDRLGRPIRHVSYPVGDPTSAGQREFRLAAEAGYLTAVTTRPGLLFPGHRERLMSLPRVSVNGNHQTVRDLDVLLSGAAFALWNKGRLVAPV